MNRSLVWSAALFLTVLALLPWVSEAAGPAVEPRVADDAQDFVFFSETRPLLIRLHVHIDGKPLLANGMVQAPSADALNDALFTLLDTSKDGKLSKDELAAAPALLLKLDANDDEMITPQELLPGSAPVDGRLAVLRLQQMTASPGANAHFMLLTPGEPSVDLARRLLARYAPRNQQSTKLTCQQLGLDEATFRTLD